MKKYLYVIGIISFFSIAATPICSTKVNEALKRMLDINGKFSSIEFSSGAKLSSSNSGNISMTGTFTTDYLSYGGTSMTHDGAWTETANGTMTYTPTGGSFVVNGNAVSSNTPRTLFTMTTPVTLTGTTTITTLWSATIPANTIGTTGSILVYHNGSTTTGNNASRAYSVKYGGTTLVHSSIAANVLCYSGHGGFYNNGSLTSQRGMNGDYNNDFGNANTSVVNLPLTASINSTADQTLSYDWTPQSATETVSLNFLKIVYLP